VSNSTQRKEKLRVGGIGGKFYHPRGGGGEEGEPISMKEARPNNKKSSYGRISILLNLGGMVAGSATS
jgi:hypothetical protein